MTAYCTAADVLLGNVPVPASAGDYVQKAADEMDSMLGMRYVTPIVLNEGDPVQRPGFLLLQRINAWLASGRLLMALDAGGEDDQLHQYAKFLLEESMAALKALADGSTTLPGGVPVNPDSPYATGPQAAWADDTSPVEKYQDVFGNDAAIALNRTRLVFFGSLNPYRG